MDGWMPATARKRSIRTSSGASSLRIWLNAGCRCACLRVGFCDLAISSSPQWRRSASLSCFASFLSPSRCSDFFLTVSPGPPITRRTGVTATPMTAAGLSADSAARLRPPKIPGFSTGNASGVTTGSTAVAAAAFSSPSSISSLSSAASAGDEIAAGVGCVSRPGNRLRILTTFSRSPAAARVDCTAAAMSRAVSIPSLASGSTKAPKGLPLGS